MSANSSPIFVPPAAKRRPPSPSTKIGEPQNAIRDKFLEKIVELVSDGGRWIVSNFNRAGSVDSELENLRARAGRIKATLEDAEQRRYIEDEAVLKRLRELRAVAYDIDDLIDEFATKKDAEIRTFSRWYGYQVSKVIDEIETRFNNISKDRKTLGLKSNEAPRRLKTILRPPESGSEPGDLNVHGRETKVGEIINLLSASSSREGDIAVISIEGVGGIGKTALAQSVYKHTKVKKMFEKWIWIDLSQQFDAKSTIKEIIKYLNNGEDCPTLSLDMLQLRLKALLENSKFLLVLDSVWNEDLHFWDTLRAPLSAGRSGSKVLMTTRSCIASQCMNASHVIVLGRLDDNSNRQVFLDQAFPQQDHDQYQDLVRIGKEIAEKCDGSPLASKLLGRLLSGNRTKDDWQNMSDEMPDPRVLLKEILPAIMRVSYDQLSLNLKRCFAYCSIFPIGYQFDKDELVKFWMAEGLINHERAREYIQIEDTGNKHFNELLGRSFFQPSSSSRKNKQKYQMPSLIHDLARSVSKFECLNVNDYGLQHGEVDGVNARYAFLSYSAQQLKNLGLICNNKSLRTLLLSNEHGPTLTKVPSNLLKLKCLRVLDMSYSQLEMLPDSIGDLIHLRYLGLRGTSLEILPKTIKKLHNLQTLELGKCYKLKEFPTEICTLTKLRHLGLQLDWEDWNSGADHLTSMPPGIGNLTDLQTLSRFSVASDENCGIDQLGKLKLRGELCVSKLENVNGEVEASKANLSQKRKIDFLMLCWSPDASSKKMRIGSADDVLNGLQPHINLKSLWIDNYIGTKFPDWMEDEAFVNLETLRLTNADSCEILPWVAKLPRLKNLYLKGLHKVKDIPCTVSIENNFNTGFPSLEELYISDMKELEALFATQEGDRLSRIHSFPSSLRKLELRNCPNLILNPSTSAPSLHELVVSGVNWAVIGLFRHLTSLQSLTIMDIPKLKHIPGRFTEGLDNLQTLKINSCTELRSLDLLNLTSLKEMEIFLCPNLASLTIMDMPKLKHIRGRFTGGLDNLQTLKINSCTELRSLDVLNLTSLREMEIFLCPNLASLPALPPCGRFNIMIGQSPSVEQFCQRNGINYTRMEGGNQH